jgi:uncharacterized protein
MMKVNTYLDKTERGDLGLFAAQNIAEGTIVWVFDPYLDRTFSNSWLESQSEMVKSYIKKFAYQTKSKTIEGETEWVLCFDDNRFLNHSDTPNLEDFEDHSVTTRDIRKGEELTCDYYRFDLHAAKKLTNDFS